MAQTVSVIVGAQDRRRLTAILGDRNRPLKHVQRANIVLLSAARLPVLEVAHRAGVSRPAVWRWQVRYAEQGLNGLLRDKTRKPGRARLSTATVAKVLALTCSEPPGAVTHWTGRAVAKTVGISLRAVQRIWEASRLQPHRLRTFKRSADRWVFHFTPKSASWINAVEGFFSAVTRRRIRRGVFKSVLDLQDAIARYIREHNTTAKPFVWTKPADAILAKLARLPEPSE